MTTINLSAESFDATVGSSEIVLVDFWASWCGPCRMFAPIFAAASETHPDVIFAKVDTEAERDLAARFQIQSIPTLMVFRDQILLYSQPGAVPAAALENIIEQVKSLDMDEIRKEIQELAGSAS